MSHTFTAELILQYILSWLDPVNKIIEVMIVILPSIDSRQLTSVLLSII